MNELSMNLVFKDDVLYLIHAMEDVIICSSQVDEVIDYAEMRIEYNLDICAYEVIITNYTHEKDYNNKWSVVPNGETSFTTLCFEKILRLAIDLNMYQVI